MFIRITTAAFLPSTPAQTEDVTLRYLANHGGLNAHELAEEGLF